MECRCAITAALGVLVGASGCHFDSLGTPAVALVASSVISAAPMQLFLEPLSFLWRAGVILVRAFGLPGLFVGSRCYFL